MSEKIAPLQSMTTGRLMWLSSTEIARLGLPSVITGLGLVLGIWGLMTGNSWLLTASMLGDILGGTVARRLNAESDLGATLDWSVDVGLSHLGVAFLGMHWLSIPLVLLQSFMLHRSTKYSGRFLVFTIILIQEML